MSNELEISLIKRDLENYFHLMYGNEFGKLFSFIVFNVRIWIYCLNGEENINFLEIIMGGNGISWRGQNRSK